VCECLFPDEVRPLGLVLTHSSPLNLRIAAKDVVLPAGGGPDGQAPLLIKAGEGLLCAFSIYEYNSRLELVTNPKQLQTASFPCIGERICMVKMQRNSDQRDGV